MQTLSGLRRDQPMRTPGRALFWIEFLMRHKGESPRDGWRYERTTQRARLLASVLLLLQC